MKKMKMSLRGSFATAAIFCLNLLSACGDDSSSNGTEPADDSASSSTVSDIMATTFDDLPVCTTKREGVMAYVKDEKTAYTCIDGVWTPDDEEISSSSGTKDREESSSSQKFASSSSAPKSSSSAAKSSSSSATSSGSKIGCKTETEDNCEYGELVDDRDGQTYKTVTIGTQIWMAQNLNYETANSYCFNNDIAKCSKYGRLYIWAAATTACPSGWHLPSKSEFETLFEAVGGSSTAGTKLKSSSGWINNGDGTDAFSFSALPAGNRGNSGIYCDEGYNANFWSSTEYGSDYAYDVLLFLGGVDAHLVDSYRKDDGFSVRCLKDDTSGKTATSSSSENPKSSSSVKSSSSFAKSSSSTVVKSSSSTAKSLSSSSVKSSSSFMKFSSSSVAKSSSSSVKSSSSKGLSASSSVIVYGTLKDSRDGQTYKTVKIGNQWWMAQNLNYEASYGSYCYNLNDGNCTKYGRLYTWTSAMDTHLIMDGNLYGICPKGWHLPTQTEWNTLIKAVGGESIAGMVLKSTSGWTGCENGTDAFGFSALPAGFYSNHVYSNEGANAVFWSSTVYDDLPAYAVYDDLAAYGVYLGYKYGDYAYMSYLNENVALSVRCLQD